MTPAVRLMLALALLAVALSPLTGCGSADDALPPAAPPATRPVVKPEPPPPAVCTAATKSCA
jgi:hypothetical protein